MIEVDDPVYSFNEVLSHIGLNPYFVPEKTVRGRGHRKSPARRLYDKLLEYVKRLKCYARHIEICGDRRNSCSKTDKDAAFMRVKRDYMGNDQLPPAYNVQLGICDGYIAVYDVKQYASDMDCFQPLMERFRAHYGFRRLL